MLKNSGPGVYRRQRSFRLPNNHVDTDTRIELPNTLPKIPLKKIRQPRFGEWVHKKEAAGSVASGFQRVVGTSPTSLARSPNSRLPSLQTIKKERACGDCVQQRGRSSNQLSSDRKADPGTRTPERTRTSRDFFTRRPFAGAPCPAAPGC